jgi:Sigma-70, region 4
VYQQRAVELARLRRAAIEEAHRDRGLSYTEIAEALGITKGRITQIRDTAPLPERRSSVSARSASASLTGTG